MPDETQELLQRIDRLKLPAHVAIIMDGNGRWARRRRLPRLFGHRAGAKTVRRIVEDAGRLGVRYLTLYAFSSENWLRPKSEINGLMRLLKHTLKTEIAALERNNVRLESIGDTGRLPPDVRETLEKTKASLNKNSGLTLVLALNYGGRQEIVQACNAVAAQGHAVITEELLSSQMQTAAMPDPDLLIRTSGEMRVSNFLLWQIAYTELYVTPVLWPDFGTKDFYRAIVEFQSRDRRFGGIS